VAVLIVIAGLTDTPGLARSAGAAVSVGVLAATVVLAMHAAAAVLATAPGTYPGVPTGLLGLAVMLAAAVLYWAINYGLVAAAILISTPTMTANDLLATAAELVIEIGAIAWAWPPRSSSCTNPPCSSAWSPPARATPQRARRQFQRASAPMQKPASYTPPSGTNSPNTSSTPRCAAQRSRPDDRPRPLQKVNDTYGHPAGDQVLAAVAAEVKLKSANSTPPPASAEKNSSSSYRAISATDLQQLPNASAGTSKSSPSHHRHRATAQPSSTTSPPPSAPRSTPTTENTSTYSSSPPTPPCTRPKTPAATG